MATSKSPSPSPGGDLPVRRIDRVLAFMSLGLLVLSLACFVAIMIGSGLKADFGTPIWQTVGLLVYVAPILAFVLLLAVLIMTFIRRARAGKDG